MQKGKIKNLNDEKMIFIAKVQNQEFERLKNYFQCKREKPRIWKTKKMIFIAKVQNQELERWKNDFHCKMKNLKDEKMIFITNSWFCKDKKKLCLEQKCKKWCSMQQRKMKNLEDKNNIFSANVQNQEFERWKNDFHCKIKNL